MKAISKRVCSPRFCSDGFRRKKNGLLARLTAWTQQVYDPSLRAQLLDHGLGRMRKEAPDQFLELIAQWLQPERTRLMVERASSRHLRYF